MKETLQEAKKKISEIPIVQKNQTQDQTTTSKHPQQRGCEQSVRRLNSQFRWQYPDVTISGQFDFWQFHIWLVVEENKNIRRAVYNNVHFLVIATCPWKTKEKREQFLCDMNQSIVEDEYIRTSTIKTKVNKTQFSK